MLLALNVIPNKEGAPHAGAALTVHHCALRRNDGLDEHGVQDAQEDGRQVQRAQHVEDVLLRGTAAAAALLVRAVHISKQEPELSTKVRMVTMQKGNWKGEGVVGERTH